MHGFRSRSLCSRRMTYREMIKQTGLQIHLQTINTLGLFNLYFHYVFKDPSAAWNKTKAAEACLSLNLVLEKYHQQQFGKLELADCGCLKLWCILRRK